MPTEWLTATIEDIADKVRMGPFGSSIKVETFVPDGVPIINGQHLHGIRLDDSAGFNFISDEHAERLANSIVQRGDIVLTHRGTIGQIAYVPSTSKFSRYIVSQSQFLLRCKQAKALPEFVTMYFQSPAGRHKLLANSTQVGVPSIARPVTYLRTIEISLPPLPEQRSIAHILGTLDDKIELNQRMNKTLEAIARALFKDWFVDFGPLRAMLEGRSIGLPRHVTDLFPNKLVDSNLGEIPDGWIPKPLGHLIELRYGKALKAAHRQHDGDVPVYGSNGQVGWHNNSLVTGPGIVVGRKGNPGTITWVHSNFYPIDTAFYVVPKSDSYTMHFLHYALKHQDLASLAADSAVPGLNRNLAYMSKQVIPAESLLQHFTIFSAHLLSKIHQLEKESRILASIRDILLPKLISGEIRVREAEKLVEAVA